MMKLALTSASLGISLAYPPVLALHNYAERFDTNIRVLEMGVSLRRVSVQHSLLCELRHFVFGYDTPDKDYEDARAR